MQLLGGLTPEQFLQDYWQQRPLLVRQAVTDFDFPLSPDELAGLACEDEVESRLVLEQGDPPWQVEYGPFAESRFARLPASHWTLLVQKVNQLIPQAALLLDRFDFLPGWRIDDLMVSYAPKGGSVGPHVDQYDVFLLQARGRRRWQISQADVSRIPLLEDTELKILREFEAQQDWLLEPGDMLYLPPNLAHHGVAQDDACMTWSIGFRAPACNELLTAWLDDRIALLPDSQRYTDPGLTPPRAAGEIDERARRQIRAIIRQQCATDEEIDRWFGRYITEPPAEQDSGVRLAEWSHPMLRDALHSRAAIWRNESQRFAWLEAQERLYLYVNGEEFELDWQLRDLAELIGSRRKLATADLQAWLENPAAADLLLELLNRGALEFHAKE